MSAPTGLLPTGRPAVADEIERVKPGLITRTDGEYLT